MCLNLEMTIPYLRLTESHSLFSEDSLKDQELTMHLSERRTDKQLSGKSSLKRAQLLLASERLIPLSFTMENVTSSEDKTMTPISSTISGNLILRPTSISKLNFLRGQQFQQREVDKLQISTTVKCIYSEEFLS